MLQFLHKPAQEWRLQSIVKIKTTERTAQILRVLQTILALKTQAGKRNFPVLTPVTNARSGAQVHTLNFLCVATSLQPLQLRIPETGVQVACAFAQTNTASKMKI